MRPHKLWWNVIPGLHNALVRPFAGLSQQPTLVQDVALGEEGGQSIFSQKWGKFFVEVSGMCALVHHPAWSDRPPKWSLTPCASVLSTCSPLLVNFKDQWPFWSLRTDLGPHHDLAAALSFHDRSRRSGQQESTFCLSSDQPSILLRSANSSTNQPTFQLVPLFSPEVLESVSCGEGQTSELKLAACTTLRHTGDLKVKAVEAPSCWASLQIFFFKPFLTWHQFSLSHSAWQCPWSELVGAMPATSKRWS